MSAVTKWSSNSSLMTWFTENWTSLRNISTENVHLFTGKPRNTRRTIRDKATFQAAQEMLRCLLPAKKALD